MNSSPVVSSQIRKLLFFPSPDNGSAITRRWHEGPTVETIPPNTVVAHVSWTDLRLSCALTKCVTNAENKNSDTTTHASHLKSSSFRLCQSLLNNYGQLDVSAQSAHASQCRFSLFSTFLFDCPYSKCVSRWRENTCIVDVICLQLPESLLSDSWLCVSWLADAFSLLDTRAHVDSRVSRRKTFCTLFNFIMSINTLDYIINQ